VTASDSRHRLRRLRRLASRALGRSRAPERRVVPRALEEAFLASEITPLNLYFLNECVQRIERLGIDGDIVEAGVYRGGSAAVLGWSMLRYEDRPRRLWLFDSFSGFPAAGERDGDFSQTLAGSHAAGVDETRALLERVGVPENRYEIVAGFFEDAYPTLEAPRTALLHIDCDLYESVKLTLEKFFPALSPGGFVIVNDYGIYRGANAATNEFLEANGIEVEPVALDPTAAFFQKPGDGYSGLPVAGHYEGWPGAVA
jgi:O-methyltransferase